MGQMPPFARVAAITAIVSQFASMAQHLPIKIKFFRALRTHESLTEIEIEMIYSGISYSGISDNVKDVSQIILKYTKMSHLNI